MLVIPVRLRKVPDGTGWAIVATASQDCCASVVINILVCPLPHIPDHIHHAKWTPSIGVCINIAGRLHHAAMI